MNEETTENLITVNLTESEVLYLSLQETRNLYYTSIYVLENGIDPITVGDTIISREDACRISNELEQYVETFDELYPWFYEPEPEATPTNFNWKKEGF